MAFDELYIANRMLLKVGADSISSLGKTNKNSRLIKQVYDGIVNEVFHSGPNWHFATTRAELTELATKPAFGWERQFGYPQGIVKVIKTLDEKCREVSFPYRREVLLTGTGDKTVETDVMLCNQEKVFIKYVYLRTNPASWPGWFQALVIAKGAKEMLWSVKKDDFKSLDLRKELEDATRTAKAENSAEFMETSQMGRDVDRGNNDLVNAQQTVELGFHGYY